VATDNAKLAKGSFDAFRRGDVEKYISYFSEDVEWRVSAFVTGKRAYHGHDGIREFFADVARLHEEQGEEFTADYDEFIEVDENRVIALGKGKIRREQDPLEMEVGLLYIFKDGKIAELEGYTGHQEARDAAGLT
jgi:ketosteroid isomerase-like protein